MGTIRHSSLFSSFFLLLLLLFLQIAQGSSKTAEDESHGDGSSRRRAGGVNSDLKLNRKEILNEKEEGSSVALEKEADEESSVALEKEAENESLVSVVDVPLSCPARCFRLNPVCGVDGQTYWCGAVDAGCAGVAVDYAGFCEFVSKGSLGGKALESLLLVHMVWLILTALFLLVGAP